MINRVVGLYFSPRGGTAEITKRITNQVAAELERKCTSGQEIQALCYDIEDTPASMLELDRDSVVVIGMPVRIGKLSLPAVSKLKKIQGGGAMAVEIVSYGAFSYGNALYELHHHAEVQGFRIIGAGAFVAKHGSARDGLLLRPDTEDYDEIRDFSSALAGKLARLSGCQVDALRIKPAPITVSGSMPVHRISKLSPMAAVVAELTFEKVNLFRKKPEWYL